MTHDHGGLTRYLDDGSIDPLFGVAGRVSVPFNARSMVLQADGKILVIGNAVDASAGDIGVARYLASGNLDTTFDQDGIAIVDFYKRFDEANDIAVQPDGKIVILGTSSSVVVISRLLGNGGLDTSFDGDGKKYFNATRGDFAAALALTPDGKILVLGESYTSPNQARFDRNLFVARLLANGALDNSFDGDGIRTIEIGDTDFPANLIVGTDGKILIAGSHVTGATSSSLLVKLLVDGQFDTTFDGDGIRTDPIEAIVLGSYVDGFPVHTENDLFIARLRNDLEPAQSTLISVVDGAILVVDQWARDDALNIYREGANLVIFDRTPDPRATLSVVGVRGSNYQSPKRVSIPWATIQNTNHPLRFWLGLGDDNVQLMTQGNTGDVVPSAGLSIGMDGGIDTIALINNTTVNNWYLNDANRVVMQLGNLGPVWVSGLDRIIGGDNADSFVLQYKGASVIPVINGGLGSDTFHINRDTNIQVNSFSLPPGSHRVTIDDVVDQSFLIENIELADIQCGPSDNVIDMYNSDVSAIIRGGAGNDRLYGGRGNDYIFGEDGDDLITGEEGNDQLFGGSGNDVLMGESGIDFIDGGSGDDLMTGAFFAYLGYYAPPAARDSVLSVWRNDKLAYSQRVTLLQTTGVGTNQQYKLVPVATARDDQSVDTLIGGSGLDWFFAKGTGPRKEIDLPQAGVRDRLSSEKLDLL